MTAAIHPASRPCGLSQRCFSLPALLCAAALWFCVSLPASASVEEGIAAYDRGAYLEALPYLLTAASLGDAEAQAYLGRMYELGQGVPESDEVAAAWYGRAAKQGHKGAAAALEKLSEAKRDGSSEEAPAETQKKPDKEARRAMRRDVGDCESGDPERQIRGCRGAIESGLLEGERLARAYGKLGEAYADKGDVEAALAAFEEAIEHAPDEDKYRRDRAQTLLEVGRYEEAIADYGTMIGRDPLDLAARLGRGQAWQGLGEAARALDDLMVVYQIACSGGPESIVRNLQEDLKGAGLFPGEIDGACGDSLRNAVMAAASGGAGGQSRARNYALFDPEALANALVGVTFEAPYGQSELVGDAKPAKIVAPTSKQRDKGLYARVVSTIDGPEARSTLEYWIFRSVAEARAAATNDYIVEQDDPFYFLSAWTGEAQSGDGPTREFLCAHIHRVQGGPPPRVARCAIWPPEGLVWIIGTIDGLPLHDENELVTVASWAWKIAEIGEGALRKRQARILRDRETGGRPDSGVTAEAPAAPDGPPAPLVGDPRALVSAIGALDLDSVTWPAPFRRPDEPVVRMADEVNRDDGLKGVVYFPMPQAAGMNAVMATVLDSPERARQAFESLPFLTEKSPKGVDPVVYRGEWTAPGVPVGKVACAYHPLSDPTRTNHHQCVFFDGASQLLLGTAVQGLSVGPTATVEQFRNAAIATGIMVWTALGQQMAALPPELPAASDPPATESPADPQALVAALSSPAFLEDFKAALERDRALSKPFQAPQQQIYQEADPVSRERGVVGRVVVVMNSEGSQNGVEFLIYDSADAAERHMEHLLITPESFDAQGGWSIKTYEIKIGSVDREGLLFFDCARSGLDNVQPSQLRCAYHAPGSRIAVTSYSYADAPIAPDSLAIIASNAGEVLDTAEAEARRVEQEVASAPAVRAAPSASGPSEAERRRMAELAGSVNRAVSGSRAFVAAEGGTVERLMVTHGAELDGSELLIDRRACLAFLVPNAPQGNECRGVDVMKPYGLAIDLAKLDPDSITVRGISPKNPVRGFAVQMDCVAGQNCARLARDDLHTRIIAKSFRETREQPKLYLTCAAHGPCYQLVEDMRALSKLARSMTPAATAKAGSVTQSLVGAWQIKGLGIMEFRADGTYTFHQPAYGHAGTYLAKDGVWSLSSETPAMPWEDGGTYRLIDQNTLELVGKLGAGTWTRTTPPDG